MPGFAPFIFTLHSSGVPDMAQQERCWWQAIHFYCSLGCGVQRWTELQTGLGCRVSTVSSAKPYPHAHQGRHCPPPATLYIVEPHCGRSAFFEVEAGRAFLDQKSKECIPFAPSPAGTVPPPPKTTANGRHVLTSRAKNAILWPEEVHGHSG